jgi:predicted ATPase
MTQAIAVAKELNDMHGLAQALYFSAWLAHFERNPTKVERLASDVIELSTRYNFAFWMVAAAILRGWARSALGYTAEGVSWIENGIGDYRATGAIIGLPFDLALKAEALHLAGRTSEALEAIKEAEAFVERSEERWWSAELHRLRGVLLAHIGADEAQIEASFCEAIRIARKQKSVSLEKRAEGTYAEYRRQKRARQRGADPATSLLIIRIAKYRPKNHPKSFHKSLSYIMQSIFRPASRREMLGEHSGGGYGIMRG